MMGLVKTKYRFKYPSCTGEGFASPFSSIINLKMLRMELEESIFALMFGLMSSASIYGM